MIAVVVFSIGVLSITCCYFWIAQEQKQERFEALQEMRGFASQHRDVLDALAMMHRTLENLQHRMDLLESYSRRYRITFKNEEWSECMTKRTQICEAAALAEALIQRLAWEEAEMLLHYLLSPRAEPGASLASLANHYLHFDLAQLHDWDLVINGGLKDVSAALKTAAVELKRPQLTAPPSRKPTVIMASELERDFQAALPKISPYVSWD